MSEPTPEVDPVDPLHLSLVAFTGLLGESLDGICSYGLTMGDSYVPFLPDEDDDACAEDEEICSQAWVRVIDVGAAATESWGGDCAVEMTLTLEVGVLRCVDIPEGGEAPDATAVLSAALQALEDMKAIQCAAYSEAAGELWGSLSLAVWSPFGPMGGQYGGTWTMTVTL